MKAASRKAAWVTALAGLLVALHAGCGSDTPELFVRPFDAGADAAAGAEESGPALDPTLGGPCLEDAQCNDSVPCTFDRCDQALSRCRNVPDDTLCADDTYCNGRETCALGSGCVAGPVVTCQDDDPCTIDRCAESSKACEHAPRDVDGDGDPDNHCVATHDCDDLDPNVSSTHSEICDNLVDDDCDGQIDEAGCVRAANDVCATALAVSASGTYLLSTVASKKDYQATCSVKTPAAGSDIVLAITVPGNADNPPADVEVWANAEVSTNEVAVALETSCGQSATEIACAHVEASPSARAIARAIAPGTVLSAIVTTQREGAVDVAVAIRPASPTPANESCASPESVTVGVPFTVALINPAKDLASGCDNAKTGELTYAFTLAEPRDVRIFASTLAGSGDAVVSLRDDTCAGELRCRRDPSVPVFARSLGAGTHVLSVSGTRPIDASVLVQTYAPTAAPPTQSCATAPPIPVNEAVTVDLSAQEDAIKNGCLAGASAAAFDVTLTEPSDVLLIARFPQNEKGAVSFNTAACATADVLGCATGPTPERVSKRNVAAGSYRVVVADELGQTAELSVLVRPAVPPTSVGISDGCVAPFVVPAAGGFFIGDTTNRSADFNAGCDAPGQPLGGARDQLLTLVLTEPRRVVFDMLGSSYATILDVRQGPGCPGVEVPSACYVGATASRSFLNLALGTGTYFVQIDGYVADKGPWNLDVRVLPP